METLSLVTNDKLLAELQELSERGHALDVQLIEHLAEFISRDLHLVVGLPSVFAYATTVLHYSRDAAQKRIRAARAVLVRPEALEHLRSRALTLSSLAVLAPVIDTNLMEKVLGQPKSMIEQQVGMIRGTKAPRGARTATTRLSKSATSCELSPTLIEKLSKATTLIRSTDADGAMARGNDASLEIEATLERALDLLIETLSADASHGANRKRAQKRKRGDGASGKRGSGTRAKRDDRISGARGADVRGKRRDQRRANPGDGAHRKPDNVGESPEGREGGRAPTADLLSREIGQATESGAAFATSELSSSPSGPRRREAEGSAIPAPFRLAAWLGEMRRQFMRIEGNLLAAATRGPPPVPGA